MRKVSGSLGRESRWKGGEEWVRNKAVDWRIDGTGRKGQSCRVNGLMELRIGGEHRCVSMLGH